MIRHLLRHLDDLSLSTRARALLHLALSLLDDPVERRLGQQEATIERLREQLEAEIEESHARESAYKGDASCLRRALKEASAESDRLRSETDLLFAGPLDQEWASLCRDLERSLRESTAQSDRLREQVTPRVFRNGDPLPEDAVWWWSLGGGWLRLSGDLLDPGDIWLPMPPPPVEMERE